MDWSYGLFAGLVQVVLFGQAALFPLASPFAPWTLFATVGAVCLVVGIGLAFWHHDAAQLGWASLPLLWMIALPVLAFSFAPFGGAVGIFAAFGIGVIVEVGLIAWTLRRAETPWPARFLAVFNAIFATFGCIVLFWVTIHPIVI